MTDKVMLAIECSLEIVLSWCISAKNLLLNCHGYSPNQLAFG